MVGWHHWPDGDVFEQAPGLGDGHGSLASCRPPGRKESDTTEQLNWTELNWIWQCWELVLKSYLDLYLLRPKNNYTLSYK